MHLEILKMFCDLAELLSISKTAEKNLLSQGAISQQLAQLETIHKCQLINRKKRPMELTQEGKLLYKACKDIIERYEQLQNELNTIKASTGSRIKVAVIFSIGMHVLPNYVKQFMINYPNVSVDIEYLSADKIYELVLAGDVDIGIVAIPKRDKRLAVYDFQEEPLVLVCSPSHPLASESEIDIHKVQFERFIAFGEKVPTRGWIDGILRRYNVIAHPTMAFDNTETIKRAVEINSGITILPETVIEPETASGTLKGIRFLNENFVRPTGIIVRKNRIRSKACKYLIKLLQQQKPHKSKNK